MHPVRALGNKMRLLWAFLKLNDFWKNRKSWKNHEKCRIFPKIKKFQKHLQLPHSIVRCSNKLNFKACALLNNYKMKNVIPDRVRLIESIIVWSCFWNFLIFWKIRHFSWFFPYFRFFHDFFKNRSTSKTLREAASCFLKL